MLEAVGEHAVRAGQMPVAPGAIRDLPDLVPRPCNGLPLLATAVFRFQWYFGGSGLACDLVDETVHDGGKHAQIPHVYKVCVG